MLGLSWYQDQTLHFRVSVCPGEERPLFFFFNLPCRIWLAILGNVTSLLLPTLFFTLTIAAVTGSPSTHAVADKHGPV